MGNKIRRQKVKKRQFEFNKLFKHGNWKYFSLDVPDFMKSADLFGNFLATPVCFSDNSIDQMSMQRWCNNTDGGTRSTRRKTCSNTTLSTINPVRIDAASNPSHQGNETKLIKPMPIITLFTFQVSVLKNAVYLYDKPTNAPLKIYSNTEYYSSPTCFGHS